MTSTIGRSLVVINSLPADAAVAISDPPSRGRVPSPAAPPLIPGGKDASAVSDRPSACPRLLALCEANPRLHSIWWMAQRYIVSSVHLKTGVWAPEGSKAFCCDLIVVLRIFLFQCAVTSPRNSTTFYAAGLVTFIKYLHIPTHTSIYMLIHAHTCK